MQSQQPISFFIPVFNAAATISDAVTSILDGNFAEGDELLLVDDGSTDASVSVIGELADRYPHLRILRHSRNRGGGAARNTAVEASSHDLLFCLDADNVLLPNSVAPLKQYLLEHRADVASFQHIRYFSGSPSEIEETWTLPAGVFTPEQGLADTLSPGAGGNYLFTKSSWIRAGGYPDFAGALDTWGFGIRQLLTGAKVMVLENSAYAHRRLPDSYFLRDAWSRRKSVSLRATQLLIPFFDQLDDRSIDYLLDKKSRYTWFEQLDTHPLLLAAKEKENPVYVATTVAPKARNYSLPGMARKVKGRLKRIWNTGRSGADPDIGANGERRELEKCLLAASEPVVIFDIGANIGDYTRQVLELAALHGKRVDVHLFEPQQHNATMLNSLFAATPHVYVNAVGLSDQPATRSIFREEAGSALGSVYYREFFKEQRYQVSEEPVEMITLERYFSDHDIKKVDFMKIDVEGHELAVITGIGKFLHTRIIRSIQFEYGGTYRDAGTTLREVYAQLSSDYHIGKIDPSNVKFGPFKPTMEDFNYANFLAVLKSDVH